MALFQQDMITLPEDRTVENKFTTLLNWVKKLPFSIKFRSVKPASNGYPLPNPKPNLLKLDCFLLTSYQICFTFWNSGMQQDIKPVITFFPVIEPSNGLVSSKCSQRKHIVVVVFCFAFSVRFENNMTPSLVIIFQFNSTLFM